MTSLVGFYAFTKFEVCAIQIYHKRNKGSPRKFSEAFENIFEEAKTSH